jgi:hypothetical protein
VTKHTPPTTDTLADDDAGTGKGRATPTRKEREAQNKRPLVPGDRKEAQKAARAKIAEQRERARVGMAAGDEKYLPERDRGPQKKWTRDYVDARTTVGEFFMPFVLIMLLLSFWPDPVVPVYSMLALWVFFGLVVLDSIFLGLTVRRKLTAKFGSADRGVRWYAAMRALQPRLLRLPKPQVKRRQYPS